MGSYEDLLRSTVEAVLQPGQPMRIAQLARVVAPRMYEFSKDRSHPDIDAIALEHVLRANPALFVEVAPGVWMRRADGPEAGVPSRRKRPPFAGSAAAAAAPPEQRTMIDAVGSTGGRASPAQS